MNDINLYEKIPEEDFPVKLYIFKDSPCEPCGFELHWHEHTEIHYVFEGSLKLRCGDNIVSVGEKECCIINGNELHEGCGGVCTRGCIILHPSFFDDNHIIFQHAVNDEFVSELVENIFSEFREEKPGMALAIKGYAYQLLAYLMRNYSVQVLTELTYRHYYEKLSKINEAVKYIRGNYSENITTKMLAGMVHMSEGHFCRIFKEVTGKTAKEYLNDIRISKAEMLLYETEMTVSEAAFCCGFSDANYFARIFKKYKGRTPSSVRNVQ